MWLELYVSSPFGKQCACWTDELCCDLRDTRICQSTNRYTANQSLHGSTFMPNKTYNFSTVFLEQLENMIKQSNVAILVGVVKNVNCK